MKVGTSSSSVMVDTLKGGVGSDVSGDVTQDFFGGGVKRPLERSGEASAPSMHDEEEARFSSSQNVEDAQVADGSHVSTRGTKRVADAQLEPELESLDVGESRKRPLEHNEGCWTMLVFVFPMIVA